MAYQYASTVIQYESINTTSAHNYNQAVKTVRKSIYSIKFYMA